MVIFLTLGGIEYYCVDTEPNFCPAIGWWPRVASYDLKVGTGQPFNCNLLKQRYDVGNYFRQANAKAESHYP